ncbi:hypothetical protein ACRRTK_024350 [Alexandromys fortis]
MAHLCGAGTVWLPSLARSILATSVCFDPSRHPLLTLTSSWQGAAWAVGGRSLTFPFLRGGLGGHPLSSSCLPVSPAAVELSFFQP